MFKQIILCAWLLIAGVFLITACKEKAGNSSVRIDSTPTEQKKGKSNKASEKRIPEYVLGVLQYVNDHDEAPDGYVGGRTFQNREKNLPQKEDSGKRIQYREWDVYPKVKGKNRGAERLVTGSDGSAWYTKDHYDSFVKIE
jgi:ribonuclease T1